jgi:hypothetical protein
MELKSWFGLVLDEASQSTSTYSIILSLGLLRREFRTLIASNRLISWISSHSVGAGSKLRVLFPPGKLRPGVLTWLSFAPPRQKITASCLLTTSFLRPTAMLDSGFDNYIFTMDPTKHTSQSITF